LILVVGLGGCGRNADSAHADLERKFQESMRGASMIGHFSAGGKESREDRYFIEGISKVTGETWLFRAKIGKRDLVVPIPVTVKWAGDTPVITLTDLAIPGMGSYTARVLFYRDQYAGTWSAKDHGGQMWGRIERGR
jgi:hypothetical protein